MKKVKGSWQKLFYINDWGVVAIFLGDKKKGMSASNTTGVQSQVSAGNKQIMPGQTWCFLFPDGTKTECELGNVKKRATVGDMGHNYDVEYDMPTIEAEVNGIKMKVELMDIIDKIKVWVE